jgi:Fe-S oxidoreductase
MLPTAKKEIQRTLTQLRSFVRGGVPVLVMEPSTATVFRQDMAGLFPNDEDVKRLSNLTYLLSEFIDERKLEVPHLGGRAIFHGHCHQKAALHPQAMRTVLTKMGIEFEEPQPGCCGMAGSFGLESPHYKISTDIGELNLLPAVRKADQHMMIIADGFSCRTQIMEGARRQAHHLSEVLRMAFEKNKAA